LIILHKSLYRSSSHRRKTSTDHQRVQHGKTLPFQIVRSWVRNKLSVIAAPLAPSHATDQSRRYFTALRPLWRGRRSSRWRTSTVRQECQCGTVTGGIPEQRKKNWLVFEHSTSSNRWDCIGVVGRQFQPQLIPKEIGRPIVIQRANERWAIVRTRAAEMQQLATRFITLMRSQATTKGRRAVRQHADEQTRTSTGWTCTTNDGSRTAWSGLSIANVAERLLRRNK